MPIPILPSSLPSPAAAKIPFTSIRKSLRLVVDEQEDLEEPKDVSYVYSGYAPLSVRLVQCVVQKGGVLNDANGDKQDAKNGKSTNAVLGKVRAHPILGWKGFEDVLEAIPGETFDVIQTGHQDGTTRPSGTLCKCNSGHMPQSTDLCFMNVPQYCSKKEPRRAWSSSWEGAPIPRSRRCVGSVSRVSVSRGSDAPSARLSNPRTTTQGGESSLQPRG